MKDFLNFLAQVDIADWKTRDDLPVVRVLGSVHFSLQRFLARSFVVMQWCSEVVLL